MLFQNVLLMEIRSLVAGSIQGSELDHLWVDIWNIFPGSVRFVPHIW